MLKEHLKYFIGFCCVVLSQNIFAQNEHAKWYFGNQAALDFMTNPPTILTNNVMNQWEGCASIANSSGTLLFYTDGLTVWNASHVVMANGTGLAGDPSTTQSAIIIKQPGSTTLYYIFTLEAGGQTPAFHYSIVDMSLATGAGSVTVKNTLLHSSSLSEKMTYVRHCNGSDYWVIVHDAGNPGAFRVFALTSTGVNTTPVVSITGPASIGNGGTMKSSPNGRKIASVRNLSSSVNWDLFDFDPATGVVSFLYSITNGFGSYGCEFSPDGNKLYVASYSPSNRICQWDLCAGSATAVAATEFTMASTALTAAMQIAPNGKIYCVKDNSSNMGVIHNPNVLGSGCGYVDLGQSLTPKLGRLGLPNFTAAHAKLPPPPFTFTVNNSLGCQTASFTAPSIVQNFTTNACSSSGYSLTGIQWNFGDPGSGSANTSTLANPAHAFPNLGTYTVQLVIYYSCGGGTDTIKQAVNVNQPCISVSSTSITCASLGSATVVATGGTGPYSYTWMPSAQTNSVATGLSPGSYTITVFDFGNNFTYTASTLFTSLIPLNGTISTATNVTCFGANTGTGSVTNLTGGSGNQFYSWFNGTQNYTTAVTNSLSAGVWSITVTDALTGCQINQSFFITQPPAMLLTLSASQPSACVGQSIVLTGTNSGGTPGYTYTWTNGPASVSKTVTEITGATYTYTLNSRDVNACLTSNTIAVNFVPNPTITVSNVSICPLTVGTLTATGASTYLWNNSVAGNNFSDNPSSNTQYSVVGSASGCTASATASIVLHPVPVPVLNHNSPVCNGQTLQFGGSGGVSYLWAGPQAFNSGLQSAAVNNASPLNSGIYNLTVTSVNGCTAATSASLTVHPTPTVSATGATVCTTQTMQLFSNSVPGAGFSWTGPLFNSVQQNPVVNNPPLNLTGTYTVKVTSVNGCTNQATAQVSVLSPPVLTSVLSDYSLCAQNFNNSANNITLVAGGASTYTLLTPANISSAGGPVFSMLPVAPFVNSASITSVTLIGSNGVCSSARTNTFIIIPNPVITLSTAKPSICAGQSNTVYATGASFYGWSPTSGLTLSSTGSQAISAPPVTAAYSVFGASVGCNSASQTISLTVFALPVVTITPFSPTICLNEKITLTAIGTGTAFSWSPFNGLNNTVGATVIASPGSTQTYSVIASVNNCTQTTNVTVTVHPLPHPVLLKDKSAVCMNEQILFSGSGGKEYTWYGPNNFFQSGQQVKVIAGNAGVAGTYTLTVTDSLGCKSSTATSIMINVLPQGDLLGLKADGCAPLCMQTKFSSQSSQSNISSTWEIDRQLFKEKFAYCFNESGTFLIKGKLYDSLTTCTNTINYEVNVHANPDADFKYLPVSPVENVHDVYFSNASIGEEQAEWNWFINDKDNKKEFRTESATHFFREAGLYPVALVVKNKWGCADTVVKSIKIETDFALFVPNVFTPNADDHNEIFNAVARGVRMYNLKIFNRWGVKIFESSDLNHGWDGSYEGGPCKQDVYSWKIVVSTIHGEAKELSGHVSLIR